MYPLTSRLVDFLVGDRAQVALKKLAQQDVSAGATLARLTVLRRQFTPSQAAALLDQARLRQRARAKFPGAQRLLFTDEALQQASSHAIARFRADRFSKYRRVVDLGCGVGADTIALAEVVPEVIAVERDPIRARLASLNVAARDLAGRVRVVCADWTRLSLDVDAAFADPARRVGGKRVFRLSTMDPPISAINTFRDSVPDVAAKVAPGVSHGEIPPDAEVEFISERGTCKEALLLFGDLRRGVARTATLLPGPHQLDSVAPTGEVPVSAPRAFMYEPDPAILRATLVRTLATALDAAQIDASIAYLTSDTLVSTPFARAWRVSRNGPFHLKTLNKWLREMSVGEVVVKKRGSPIDPDTFRRRLKTTRGGPRVTVFLTRVLDRPWMVVGQEIREGVREAIDRTGEEVLAG